MTLPIPWLTARIVLSVYHSSPDNAMVYDFFDYFDSLS